MDSQSESTQPAGKRAEGERRGLLMVNLGSPDAPTPAAVRRYLAEFLGDPLVVDVNRVLWWFILRGAILPFRSKSSARLYQSVWTGEGSPLIAISRRQRDALAERLGPDTVVELAMRYGNPSIASALQRLADAGCRRVELLSMFPQVSRTTTGTVQRAVERALQARGNDLELGEVPAYYENPLYIGALAEHVRESLQAGSVDHFVFSFHGLPERYVQAGDPYRDHCEATAHALAREIGLDASDWTLAYQSRFGREPWLGPDIAEFVPALAPRARRVLVTCPGFTADCLETLEEIGIRLSEAFCAAGGEELRVVPCLNDHPRWIEGLARLVSASQTRTGGVTRN